MVHIKLITNVLGSKDNYCISRKEIASLKSQKFDHFWAKLRGESQ